MPGLVPIFDLDGTLIDSDAALAGAFVTLGVPAESVTYGHTLAAECGRLGLSVDDYLDAYDDRLALPFDGAPELIESLDRWAVCSNKHESAGRAELARIGWEPEVALFADAFAGGPKFLGPVLRAMGLAADAVIFVGDTAHDRSCALTEGCPFVLAGWNPRAVAKEGDLVAATPGDVIALCQG